MGKGKKQESQRHTDRQTETNRQTDKQKDRLTEVKWPPVSYKIQETMEET